MKIISGKYKGRPIKAPKGATTRPTSSKVRESIFNILQGEIEGARFLDLFAGSGIMGLEALSHGAESVTFIENNKQAASCIRANLKSLEEKATLLQRDAALALKQLHKAQAQFDIIYMDPPYALDISPLFELLPPLLAPLGLLLIEQARGQELNIPGLASTDLRHFGDTCIHLFRAD